MAVTFSHLSLLLIFVTQSLPSDHYHLGCCCIFLAACFSKLLLCQTDTGQLQHKCNRLRLLATCSITITNKQNHNVIDYDYHYIVSNHDYNRDYVCLETSSERKQTH